MTTELFSSTPDTEIVSTRIFNFHRELVFKAWSNPEHLQKWWGPAGFTNTFQEFDFQIGGKWRFIMHGPDKGNYKNECEFLKIESPSLIAWKRHTQPYFKVLVTFDEIYEFQTKIVFKMLFETAEECNKVKRFVVDKNEENFDKLENELASMIS
ncbi:MAG TPA: SRPBCC family protein [Chitinophagales bacterium]|nr:SRPBCC family protein [Chitinophagales bacterium]